MSVSNEFGVMIPEEAGLEMNYMTTTQDSPTTTYGDIDIGIHYVSPVKQILQCLEEERISSKIEYGSETRFTL